MCVSQYYDTEQNLCHSLDLNSSDNTVYLSELSIANPADRELMTSLLASVDGEKVVRPCVGVWVFGSITSLLCHGGWQHYCFILLLAYPVDMELLPTYIFPVSNFCSLLIIV